MKTTTSQTVNNCRVSTMKQGEVLECRMSLSPKMAGNMWYSTVYDEQSDYCMYAQIFCKEQNLSKKMTTV